MPHAQRLLNACVLHIFDCLPIRGDTTTTSFPMMAAGSAKQRDLPPASRGYQLWWHGMAFNGK